LRSGHLRPPHAQCKSKLFAESSAGWSRVRERGAKFAAGEILECLKAGTEFGGGEAMLAVERAEVVGGGLSAFVGIAFEAAGHEIAKGIAAGAELGKDVVEAAGTRGQTTQTVEAAMTISRVDGFAKRRGGEEIDSFDIGGEAKTPLRKS